MNEWKSLFWYKKINLRRSPCSAPCILLHRSPNITTKKSSLEMWKSVLNRQLATIWISALLRTDGSVKKFTQIGSLKMLRHGRCSFTTNKISHWPEHKRARQQRRKHLILNSQIYIIKIQLMRSFRWSTESYSWLVLLHFVVCLCQKLAPLSQPLRFN